MSAVRFRPNARQDLAEIWLYTADAHGVDQAQAYVAAIGRDIDRIPDFPLRYETIRTRHGEFRKKTSGHHLIFYRLVGGTIEIVRVLHERMDVDDRLA